MHDPVKTLERAQHISLISNLLALYMKPEELSKGVTDDLVFGSLTAPGPGQNPPRTMDAVANHMLTDAVDLGGWILPMQQVFNRLLELEIEVERRFAPPPATVNPVRVERKDGEPLVDLDADTVTVFSTTTTTVTTTTAVTATGDSTNTNTDGTGAVAERALEGRISAEQQSAVDNYNKLAFFLYAITGSPALKKFHHRDGWSAIDNGRDRIDALKQEIQGAADRAANRNGAPAVNDDNRYLGEAPYIALVRLYDALIHLPAVAPVPARAPAPAPSSSSPASSSPAVAVQPVVAQPNLENASQALKAKQDLIAQYAQCLYYNSRVSHILSETKRLYAGGSVAWGISWAFTAIAIAVTAPVDIAGFGAGFAVGAMVLVPVGLLTIFGSDKAFRAIDASKKIEPVASPISTQVTPGVVGAGAMIGLWATTYFITTDPLYQVIGGGIGGMVFGVLASLYQVGIAQRHRVAVHLATNPDFELTGHEAHEAWRRRDTITVVVFGALGGALVGALVTYVAPLTTTAMLQVMEIDIAPQQQMVATFMVAVSMALVVGQLLGLARAGCEAIHYQKTHGSEGVEMV